MQKIPKKHSVKVVEGNRKTDLSKFQGLKFEGPNHADFFLTPGQFFTVVKMADYARTLIEAMPRLPKPRKENFNG